MDAIDELGNEINRLKTEMERLRSKTDLEAVQKKLSDFMDEIRLLHRGLLVTLQEMVSSLNAEGVKRYDGAIKIVVENSNSLAKQILAEQEKTNEKLSKFSMIV